MTEPTKEQKLQDLQEWQQKLQADLNRIKHANPNGIDNNSPLAKNLRTANEEIEKLKNA